MNVLVAGGAGYIGSHTAKALAARGHSPIVIDNLSRGSKRAVQWGPLVVADIGDVDKVRQAIKDYSIEGVIDFAAYAYVGESMSTPALYFDNNVASTLRFLDAIVAERVPHFIFSSSCATYGIPTHVPIEESTPQIPINPYGESKLFIERVLHWYANANILRSISLRYFNAAGADADGDIGEDHDPETHLIPLAIRAAETGSTLSIFGVDYPTIDGSAVRDYVHVSDLADAHIRALERLAAGCSTTSLNLGTGHGHSVREVIAAVERATGAIVRVREEPRRPGDPAVLVASNSQARDELGWRATQSSLDEIVNTAWKWSISPKRTSSPKR